MTYFPDRYEWKRANASDVGMNDERLRESVEFISCQEMTGPRDLYLRHQLSTKEPFRELVGPVKERGGTNGLIIRRGRIVAEWGDTRRVDMTFSVTKSYLSAIAGLAVDRGLIRSVHDPVSQYVQDGGFDSPHNAKITWHQLLNQTSSWEGSLWGKPDWADRPEGEPDSWSTPDRAAPGLRWKYNDVRVNRLALALLRVWRKPLSQVLRQEIMDPIGASRTWEWHGYDNSWVTIDGIRMQSVSGGGHWGGGVWINTMDQARFGYFCLNMGKWRDRQVLSEDWIRLCQKPVAEDYDSVKPIWSGSIDESVDSDLQVSYGYMNWFLNKKQHLLPSAPEDSYYHAGGGNVTWVYNDEDLVVVLRAIQVKVLDEFIGRLLASIG